MWYSQGSITATKDNTVVTGVGTGFLQGVRVGDGITIAGSTALHEVVSIASNTQLTIKPAYTGTTGSGKQYAVAPILGYDKDLSDAFNQLRLQFGDKLSNLQPWAHAATASAALDSLGFSTSGKSVATGTPAQGRTGLGLGAAATRDVGTEAGQVLQVGAFGLGHHPDINPATPRESTTFGGGLSLAAAHTGNSIPSGIGNLNCYYNLMHFVGGPSSGNTTHTQFLCANKPQAAGDRLFFRTARYGSFPPERESWKEIRHTGNTVQDPDGFIKRSSPIINLHTNKHDLHNEDQFGATPSVVRKSKGVYEITGTLGLRSEGWYLDTPNDRNGNKYFNIEWTQNITPDAADGVVDEYRDDIVVTIETFERVWNKNTGLFENGAPTDINDLQDRFVQLRFNEIKVEYEELDDES